MLLISELSFLEGKLYMHIPMKVFIDDSKKLHLLSYHCVFFNHFFDLRSLFLYLNFLEFHIFLYNLKIQQPYF